MRKGGGKQKGAAFERKVCVALSLWVSGGKRQDLFWRSAMSGGRATLGRRKGIDLAYQSGDVTAVHPQGHALTGIYYIECKHIKAAELERFALGLGGKTQEFWKTAQREAKEHQRVPMLILRANGRPTICVLPTWLKYTEWMNASIQFIVPPLNAVVCLFDEMIGNPYGPTRVRERIRVI